MFPTSQDQAQLNTFGTSTLAAPLQTTAVMPQASAAYGLTDTNPLSSMVGSSAPITAVNSPVISIIDPSLVLSPIYFTNNTLGTATNLGSLSSTLTRSGSVGSTDIIDYYRVSLAGAGSSLNLTLTGMTADADLQLIRDYNSNGIVDSGDAIAASNRGSSSDESINLHGLAAGEYFIGVKRFSGDTSYTLRLSPDFKSNLLATENNVGTLIGTETFTNPSYSEGETFDRRNGISSTDTSDYYRFSIGSIRNVSLGLTGIGAGTDLDMRLIRDYNNNGVIDAGEELASSNHSSNWNEAINKNLEAGDYFVQVNRYSGASTYSLKMSETVPQVRFTVNQVIAGNNPDSGWFGDDADYYARITVNGATTTTGVVSNDNNISPNWQFTQTVNSRYVNITVQLWDSDGGLAGSDDRIDIDSRTGYRDLNLTYDLITNQVTGDANGLGGRRLSVNGAGDGDRASMYFTVDSGDWYNMNLRDADVIDLTRSFAADGTLDRKDMIAILRDTKDGSVIDSTEVTDLKRILSSLGYMMPDYVENLAGKVVNGDPANPRSGIGNLFAGSTSTQMERLIGKWFLGNDRPDAAASSTYRYVSGSLFQGGANINDIDQGGVGDCYFVAALASVADNKVGYINNMFIDNGDNTYTVRFFRNGVADYVTVDRYLPVNASGNAVYAGWNGGSYTETNNELWVALAEKAYAQLNESGGIGQNNTNTYAGIDGGLAYLPMQHLTGLSASNPGTSANKADIIAKVNSDNLVSFGRQGHAYAVTSYNAVTGTFHLHNPWGHSHLDLTWAQLQSTASTGWHFTST
ncbi:C2 family cysteine protease [Leptolyngbyaceae cyanobacterium UHCC 1019]